MSTILTKAEIEKLIKSQPPLIEGYISLEEQLQGNGFDLTVREIARFTSAGQIGIHNSERALSHTEILPFDNERFVSLAPGAYLVTFNELVNLPDDITALGEPRSSLLRSGVTVASAVWDAGYSGRSQSLLVVHSPQGFRIKKNARILQLVFFKLTEKTEGYRGKYQNENKS